MIMTLLSKNGLTKALTRMTKKENDRAKPFGKRSKLPCRSLAGSRIPLLDARLKQHAGAAGRGGGGALENVETRFV